MKQSKNVHVIPTDKPSRLGYLTKKGKEVFKDLRLFDQLMPIILDSENQNICITSDEKIKEGDWVLDNEQDVFKVLDVNHTTGILRSDGFTYVIDVCKKIILTTDLDLISDGVQAIEDNFLEWFVNNPSCEEVGVKLKQHFQADKLKRENPLNDVYYFYEIIIPEEKPKQDISIRLKNSLKQFNLTLQEAINIESFELKTIGFGSKSVIEIQSLKNKRTLEEASEKILANNIDGLRDALKDDDFFFYKGVIKCYGEAMAKWQQERMYSEEDMVDYSNYRLLIKKALDPKEWFEQFKKK